jgi:ABC-type enterochelin transport system permease subunit
VSGSGFSALTTSDVNLVAGAATASSVTTLYFQTLYNWTLDTPGSYGLTIVLTLTSP